MIISLAVAMDKNRVIGDKGKLPWHIPADLKRFKSITVGKAVIMGKNTFLSLDNPLSRRINIVLTSDFSLDTGSAQKVFSIKEAMATAISSGAEEMIFIGGRKIYQAAIPIVQKMYITEINWFFEGDVFFPYPEINWDDWDLVSEEIFLKKQEGDYDLKFTVYERRKGK
jgi:dihydrofolate reductase